jgi:hypothetical protein
MTRSGEISDPFYPAASCNPTNSRAWIWRGQGENIKGPQMLTITVSKTLNHHCLPFFLFSQELPSEQTCENEVLGSDLRGRISARIRNRSGQLPGRSHPQQLPGDMQTVGY